MINEMEISDLAKILRLLEVDHRLNAWHISMLYAIIVLALKQKKKTAIRVSRSKIMALSHISTIPTYHKYFKDLQAFGYIIYRPSYHPIRHSEIDFAGNLNK